MPSASVSRSVEGSFKFSMRWMDLEYLFLSLLDGNLFPFSSVSESCCSTPPAPSLSTSFSTPLSLSARFCHDGCRAARPFIFSLSPSEKSIVRAFGSLFLLLPAASTSMSGVMKCTMENVQLREGANSRYSGKEREEGVHFDGVDSSPIMTMVMMRISPNYPNCRMSCATWES